MQDIERARLLEKIDDLENEYASLDELYTELQYNYDELLQEKEELEDKVSLFQYAITDIDDFKEKLEFYDLKSDELFNFIDLYMKLYERKD